MALKVYLWRGHTYQIADEDLCRYPGAEPIPTESAARAAKGTGRKVATPKSATEPANKSAAPAANKRTRSRKKAVE